MTRSAVHRLTRVELSLVQTACADRFGLAHAGFPAGIRTEPDSSGKSQLVLTVPQSGEASGLHAATLVARATEPKVILSGRVDEGESL